MKITAKPQMFRGISAFVATFSLLNCSSWQTVFQNTAGEVRCCIMIIQLLHHDKSIAAS
jgi:hypothetical protein